MRPNGYTTTLLAFLALAFVPAARAQYGNGFMQDVPRATGAITLDGDDSEADWATAPEVNIVQYWDPYTIPEPDIAATGKVLWSEGALYVFARYQDFESFYWGPPGQPDFGEHLLVGVDLAHVNSDSTTGFDGWPDNMPNLGPVAYKVTGALGEGNAGITANFGYAGIAPVDSGWVDGYVFIDNAAFQWGVEMAIYGVEVTEGAEIGFNIGGAAANQAYADENGGDGNYGYYSWQICDPVPPGPERYCASPGGNVMSDAGSFATLTLVGGTANEGGPDAVGFALRPNVPNPFQGATTLTYAMPRAGEVELAAYDVLGRRVAVLDAGVRAAGEHRATLDAALPSGVYTVRLAVDGAVVATRRVLRAE